MQRFTLGLLAGFADGCYRCCQRGAMGKRVSIRAAPYSKRGVACMHRQASHAPSHAAASHLRSACKAHAHHTTLRAPRR